MIVGTGAIRTEDSIVFAQAAKAIGADAMLVATPPYAYPPAARTRCTRWPSTAPPTCRSCSTIIPAACAVNMDEETLDRVGRSPNFCAIKESSGDINRVHMLARDYPHIQLSAAWTTRRSSFSPGARGLGLRRLELCARKPYRALPGLRASRAISPRAARSCRRCCR